MLYVSRTNKEAFQTLRDCLNRAFQTAVSASGKTMSDAMLNTTKNHISVRFPRSSHWDPDKVVKDQEISTNTAGKSSININIPGASRAFHDVTILPVHAKALTIPMHASAYGKKASDFDDLFTIPGKKALFQKKGSGIIALFALAQKAFQKRDKTLLPSDDTYHKNIEERFIKTFEEALDKELNQEF